MQENILQLSFYTWFLYEQIIVYSLYKIDVFSYDNVHSTHDSSIWFDPSAHQFSSFFYIHAK